MKMQELPASNPKHVVRLQAAAREIGIHPDTLRRICKDGTGPKMLKLSARCYGIRRGDLDAWVESRGVGGPQV